MSAEAAGCGPAPGSDACAGDRDGDGEADEDDNDRLGTITSYDGTDATSGTLVVDSYTLGSLSFALTEDTEIEARGSNNAGDGSDDGHLATTDMQHGLVVAELDVDDDAGALDEIKIYLP